MKRKVNLFGKEISVFVISLFAIALVSAALILNWGTITGLVTVSQGLTVDGNDWNVPIVEDPVTMTSLDAKMITSGHYLDNQADVDATVYLKTTCVGVDNCEDVPISTDTVGLSTKWSSTAGSFASAIMTGDKVSLIANGVSSGTEARITIDAEDVGITTLSDLKTMSWHVDGVLGYIAHVDVIVEAGAGTDALVFEYANVNDIAGAYPTGDDLNTFGVRGIVNNNANAWLSSGCPGTDNIVLFTLGTWQSPEGKNGEALACDGSSTGNLYDIDGETKVLRLEIEVDAWISDSSSVISSIVINDNAKTIATIDTGEDPYKPIVVEGKSGLAFYMNSDFPKMMKPGTYTITTIVDDTA